MKIEITYRGTMTVTPDSQSDQVDMAEEMDRVLDLTMDELLALTSIEDPIMSGSLAAGDVEVTVTVEAESLSDAIVAADSAIRSAFHAAGVFTHGWEDTDQAVRVEWHKVEADDLIDA